MLGPLGRRLLKPEIGDVFAIPLPDGDQALGQVVAWVEDLGAVGCALFDHTHRPSHPVPPLGQPSSVVLSTPDLLQRRYWPILGNRPVMVSADHLTWEGFRDVHWVGVSIQGSGIIRQFMEAYHGFSPWDAMADPDYFTELLIKRKMPPGAYVAGA